MTDHDALEPCPFCGGNAIVVNEDRSWIECADCPSKAVCGPFDTEAEATRAWNTRASPTLPASDEVREVRAAVCPQHHNNDCKTCLDAREINTAAFERLSAIPADPVVEQMAQALERISGSAVLLLGRHWHHVVTEMQKVAREALAAYRGK